MTNSLHNQQQLTEEELFWGRLFRWIHERAEYLRRTQVTGLDKISATTSDMVEHETASSPLWETPNAQATE